MANYRPITPDDMPAFADIVGRSFRFDAQRMVDNLSRPESRYGLESCFVYEDEERGMVAGLVAFNRTISVGGQLLDADLIASVAVPPDQRRRGYANDMLTATLRWARERTLPLSILWPYSIPFYNRLGYGIFTYGNLMELPLREMVNYDEQLMARRMVIEDLPAMQRLYAKEQLRHSGRIGRTDFEWRARLFENEALTGANKLEGIVIPGTDDELLGYMVYSITGHGGDPQRAFIVFEWVDDTTQPEGFRALAGYAAAQRAQADYLRYTAPMDSPLFHTFKERNSRHAERDTDFIYRDSVVYGPGMMGRLAHAPEAFKQRGYPKGVTGACVVAISDKQLPENEEPFLLEIEGGKGFVFENPAASSFTARADARTWSELYANALTPHAAWRLGRLEADSNTLDFLAAAFVSTPWFIHRADWF